MGDITPQQQAVEQASELLTVLMRDSGLELFRASDPHSLSLTQAVALQLLYRSEGEITVGELAEGMRMSVPTASRAVEALHQGGLARRLEGVGDRRRRRVSITDSGQAAVEALWHSRAEVVAQALEPLLTEGSSRQLSEALAPLLVSASAKSSF